MITYIFIATVNSGQGGQGLLLGGCHGNMRLDNAGVRNRRMANWGKREEIDCSWNKATLNLIVCCT